MPDGDDFAMGKPPKIAPGRQKFAGFPYVKEQLRRGDQTKLARACNVSPEYLSQVLSGERGPSPALEERMAKHLRTTRDGLRRPAIQAEVIGYIDRLEKKELPRVLRVLKGIYGEGSDGETTS